MRIAFISYEYPPETVTGGIGTYTVQVSSLLAANGFDVHVFAGSHIATIKSSEQGVTIHRVNCGGPEDFRENVVPYFAAEHGQAPFEMVESPEIHANGAKIKKLFPRVPLQVRLHASNQLVESFKKKYIPLKNKIRFFLGALRRGRWDLGYWRSYRYQSDPDYLFAMQAEYISVPSNEMKKYVEQNWKIAAKKINVIGNPFFQKAGFKAAKTENNSKTIIFYGRLNVLKGLMTATAAMKTVLKNNPEWNWLIIGEDGPGADGRSSMKEYMQDQLRATDGRITFIGPVENERIPCYLKEASIVLIPSLFESYSYVTIETMSAGKAIVGSSGTAIASLVTDNVTGKLADPYKVQDWVVAIQELIDAPELRKNLGEAAYRFAENCESVNKEITEYYTALIAVGGGVKRN